MSSEPPSAATFTRRRLLLATGGALAVAAAAAVPAVLLTRRGSNQATPLVIEPGSVVRIDPDTNEPVKAVRLDGGRGSPWVAVGEGAAWVAYPESGTVSRIDTTDGECDVDGCPPRFYLAALWPDGLRRGRRRLGAEH